VVRVPVCWWPILSRHHRGMLPEPPNFDPGLAGIWTRTTLKYVLTRDKYSNASRAHDGRFPQRRPGGYPNKEVIGWRPDVRHQADLSVCWREETHAQGSIQHGSVSFIAGLVAHTSG